MPRKQTAPTTPAPTMEPPATEAAAAGGVPQMEVTDLAVMQGNEELVPTMVPPSEETAIAAEGVTAWHSNTKVTGLWSNAANRNSWVALQGVGWRKIADTGDSSVVALTQILSHARQAGAAVNVREEADGKIYEAYCW